MSSSMKGQSLLEGYEFPPDWFSNHIPAWTHLYEWTSSANRIGSFKASLDSINADDSERNTSQLSLTQITGSLTSAREHRAEGSRVADLEMSARAEPISGISSRKISSRRRPSQPDVQRTDAIPARCRRAFTLSRCRGPSRSLICASAPCLLLERSELQRIRLSRKEHAL
jgi:hypothetical protein